MGFTHAATYIQYKWGKLTGTFKAGGFTVAETEKKKYKKQERQSNKTPKSPIAGQDHCQDLTAENGGRAQSMSKMAAHLRRATLGGLYYGFPHTSGRTEDLFKTFWARLRIHKRTVDAATNVRVEKEIPSPCPKTI